MNELVSCIVPVYDSAAFLGETLDSVLAQTYAPLEVIVVDDGNAADTRALVERYGERVGYLAASPGGHPGACNAGITAARGEYIALLDAGDIWLPGKTARQMDALAAHPEAGASVTLVQNFWMDEIAADRARFVQSRRGQPVPGYAYISLLARRGAFEQVGVFDPALRYAADTEWFLRAEQRGVKVELVREVLVTRRMHATGPSEAETAASRAEHLEVFKRYRDSQLERTLEAQAQAEAQAEAEAQKTGT